MTGTIGISLPNILGSTGINVFYRVAGASAWTNNGEVSDSATSASISGLLPQTIYEFMLQNVNGTTNPNSTIGRMCGFYCPSPVTITPTNTTAAITFPSQAASVSSYVLSIALASAPGVVVGTATISAASTTINYTFTGLTPSSNYIISILTTAAEFTKTCQLTTTTLATATIGSITGLTATITGILPPI